MAYRVTIEYVGLTPANDQLVAHIARHYRPKPSYVDTPAFEGTVYDTNRPGMAVIPQMEPFASTHIPFPVPLTQFRLATVGNPVTFVVDDYKEAFSYKQLGVDLLDQGFVITVAEIAA